MSQQNWKFADSFVWIYNYSEQIIGAGFLIGWRDIATCAHVVRAALRLESVPDNAPEGNIILSFPFLKQDKPLLATILAEGWDKEKDIAVLQADVALPEGVHPAMLSTIPVDELENHPFCVYGPLGIKGVWADGVIKRKREHGLVQLESASLVGYKVQDGFSGGPVFDKELKTIVGMIVTSDKSARVASMIPVNMLASVCGKAGIHITAPVLSDSTKYMSAVGAKNVSPLLNVRLTQVKEEMAMKRELCENCLKESFTARDKEEFISLCMNHIPEVGRKLDDNYSIDRMINRVLDYIFNRKEFEKLCLITKKSCQNQHQKSC